MPCRGYRSRQEGAEAPWQARSVHTRPAPAGRRFLVAALGLGLSTTACLGGTHSSQPTPVAGLPTSPAATPSARAAGATVLGVLGDFGIKSAAARAVVSLIASWRPDGVVTTGDNAYESGTVEETAFARALIQPALDQGARLVASLGNHDEENGIGRPVMAAFGMPGRWYSTVIGHVQLVVLDANIPRDPDQLAWLRMTLALPRTVSWRIAVFHQPAVSCSFHTASSGVIKNWLPLFHGKIDLVLSGHNHTYERFLDSAGLSFVTTGGGGNTLYPSGRALCGGPATPVYFNAFFHAVRIEATARSLQLQAIEPGGTVRDELTLHR